MSGHNNDLDGIFKKIANEYAEQYGDELKKEYEMLERNSPQTITPGLDAKVKAKIAPRKKINYRILGLVAACLVVAVMVPVMYSLFGERYATSDTTQHVAEEAADETATAEEAPAMAEDTVEEAEAADEAPAMEEPAEDSSAGSGASTAQDVEEYEIIPLGFELPENFTVETVEQDVGKTIYYLQDMRLDDTVLTLERSDGFIVPDGLKEYEINGQTAYGTYQPDYSFLTFEKDGIVYEMTCEHDLNTLLELGAAIL